MKVIQNLLDHFFPPSQEELLNRKIDMELAETPLKFSKLKEGLGKDYHWSYRSGDIEVLAFIDYYFSDSPMRPFMAYYKNIKIHVSSRMIKQINEHFILEKKQRDSLIKESESKIIESYLSK